MSDAAVPRSLASQLDALSTGIARLPTGDRATLRRMTPETPARAMPVLVPLLLGAGADGSGGLGPDQLRRWARIVHAMAILSGTSGEPPHKRRMDADKTWHAARDPGRALAIAFGFEPGKPRGQTRMLRLTSSRGDALNAQLPRIMRILAANGGGPVDFSPIARLMLNDGRDDRRADEARLDLARGFFASTAVESDPIDATEKADAS
jgi:hypothetical protein